MDSCSKFLSTHICLLIASKHPKKKTMTVKAYVMPELYILKLFVLKCFVLFILIYALVLLLIKINYFPKSYVFCISENAFFKTQNVWHLNALNWSHSPLSLFTVQVKTEKQWVITTCLFFIENIVVCIAMIACYPLLLFFLFKETY